MSYYYPEEVLDFMNDPSYYYGYQRFLPFHPFVGQIAEEIRPVDELYAFYSYEDSIQYSSNSIVDERPPKKRRTNYKNPENAAKLQSAVKELISRKISTQGAQDIRSIAKMYDIPYNTLRDNYLRAVGCDLKSPKGNTRKVPQIENLRESSLSDASIDTLSETSPTKH